MSKHHKSKCSTTSVYVVHPKFTLVFRRTFRENASYCLDLFRWINHCSVISEMGMGMRTGLTEPKTKYHIVGNFRRFRSWPNIPKNKIHELGVLVVLSRGCGQHSRIFIFGAICENFVPTKISHYTADNYNKHVAIHTYIPMFSFSLHEIE